MNEKQEKALLRGLAIWMAHPGPTALPLQEARAYLAALEPKPEPKRGVEEILADVAKVLGDIPRWGAQVVAIREALRLYREERERVEKVREDILANALSEVTAKGLLRSWAQRLERRDAD